jgi:hypothetical protein
VERDELDRITIFGLHVHQHLLEWVKRAVSHVRVGLVYFISQQHNVIVVAELEDLREMKQQKKKKNVTLYRKTEWKHWRREKKDRMSQRKLEKK